MKIFQKGFNYSQDGPGNRLVYHLQGCNFKCKWCSNPESMTLDSADATDYTKDYIIDEIWRSRMMFFDGGGVTFTGGEPTMQYEDLVGVLREVHGGGIHTAVETNGSHPGLVKLSDYVDCLMMDIKHVDDDIHRYFTGHGNRETLKNLESFTSQCRQLHIRIPLINHVNTDPEPFVRLFSTLDMSNVDIEVLRYHEYGKCKWTEEYEIRDGFVTDEDYEFFISRLKNCSYKIIKT